MIVHDIVAFARERGILCQGRGSAASSAVCYALGITAVDAVFYRLPFERFISAHRDEEPDIDVDFDSDRREEVIQWVYDPYGRRNAAQVANVIAYRPRMAVRDAAKALGFSPGQQDAWSKQIDGWKSVVAGDQGDPAAHDVPAPVVALADELMGAPRHLGIHSGGMVLTERPIGEVCPIERARMDRRTVLQWDKDACESMGLVKFDLLGLGMLGALDHMMRMVADHLGEHWDLATMPKEEPAVYDMLCRADSIGVFQVESRAQIGTLPRLRPREFYDLAIEIALIRPGPIQGGAVHPYVRRATGREAVTYAHPELVPVLERTQGVPLFQEQLMAMAVTLGDCSRDDADLLRRAMGSKRGVERIESVKHKLYAGMARRGITGELADSIYVKILSFANFGFAESHALSFALLVYASSWFKLHYPAAFLAGLLRNQPMGFYSPQSLVGGALMGWNNPAMHWKELERRLSGLPGADDAPVSRRKRASTEARSIERPAAVTPYAELHCHSHFSFLDGASSPAELVEEAVRLGLHALAVTDHDGFYAAPMLAEAAAAYDLPTVFGAELSLDLTSPQNGVPDPEGSHLLVLARGVEGYHRLAAAMTDAHLRGDEKGRPHYDLDDLAERGRGHWVVLTGCRKGAVQQALAQGGETAAGEALDRLTALFGPEHVLVELSPRPGADTHQRLARPVRRHPRPRRRRGRQRPPRHAPEAPAGLGDGGRARSPQPGRAGRLARPVRLGPPAQRRRDGRGARGVPP